MKKNILFTAPFPFHPLMGGVERVTDSLCRAFLQRGYCCFYLNLSWETEERKSYSYPVPVSILPCEDSSDQRNIDFYQRYLEDNEIDVVINQDGLYRNSKLFLNIGNRRVKKISVLHSNPIENYDHLWSDLVCLRNCTTMEKIKRIGRCLLYLKLKREKRQSIKSHFSYLLSNTDHICLLSDEYKNNLQRINPKLLSITQTVHNPNTYIQQECIPDKENEILFVGRIDNRSKKVFRLLRIWRALFGEFPEWRLSIVGDGPDLQEVQLYSKKNCLKNITFYGFSDPMPFYKRASIVCLTSNFEGFPMVLTEAMQFGCVPIAFDSFEAVRDIIVDQFTGVLIAPFKLNEYRDALSFLMKDEITRKRLSENAFCHVRQFDIDIVVEKWLNLINS